MPKPLMAFSRAIDAVNERFGRIAVWLVLVCCLVSAGNAVSRYAFDLSSNAWLEAQWYMFGGIVMLGAAATLRANEHVRVDLFYGRLSPRGKARLDLAGIVVFLLPSMIVLGWLSWPFLRDSWAIGEMSGNPGGLVRWPAKALLPLGFLLLALQSVSEAIKRAAFLRGGEAQVDLSYERPLQ